MEMYGYIIDIIYIFMLFIEYLVVWMKYYDVWNNILFMVIF